MKIATVSKLKAFIQSMCSDFSVVTCQQTVTDIISPAVSMKHYELLRLVTPSDYEYSTHPDFAPFYTRVKKRGGEPLDLF